MNQHCFAWSRSLSLLLGLRCFLLSSANMHTYVSHFLTLLHCHCVQVEITLLMTEGKGNGTHVHQDCPLLAVVRRRKKFYSILGLADITIGGGVVEMEYQLALSQTTLLCLFTKCGQDLSSTLGSIDTCQCREQNRGSHHFTVFVHCKIHIAEVEPKVQEVSEKCPQSHILSVIYLYVFYCLNDDLPLSFLLFPKSSVPPLDNAKSQRLERNPEFSYIHLFGITSQFCQKLVLLIFLDSGL